MLCKVLRGLGHFVQVLGRLSVFSLKLMFTVREQKQLLLLLFFFLLFFCVLHSALCTLQVAPRIISLAAVEHMLHRINNDKTTAVNKAAR